MSTPKPKPNTASSRARTARRDWIIFANRRLWGVEFSSPLSPPDLLGQAWNVFGTERESYLGEPTRALLFCTRATARVWCKAKRATYAGRTDCCRAWRFRAVPVWERVTKVKT